MRILRREDFALGKPLPFPVFDKKGNLLLRKGFVISSADQLDRLLERGLCLREDSGGGRGGDQDQLSVYQRIGSATLRLKPLLNDLRSASPSADVLARLSGLARELRKLAQQDPESALAAVHLDFHNVHLLAHPVHRAVLGAVLSPRLSVGEAQLHALMCAALTCDLGMVELFHLEKQKTRLDADQSDEVSRHVERSLALLRRVGVNDSLWLSTVADHHERLDGKGYPNNRVAADISPLAKLLAVLDSYLAMIKPRPWRPAMIPLAAMKELHGLKGTSLAGNLCDALIKELGLYPPGAIVRLTCQEVAVVTRRGKDIHTPAETYSVYEPSGIPRMTPVRRDPSDAKYAVQSALSYAECRSASLIIPRIWTGH